MPIPTLHAVVLGAVQGLTEFFPISSSGHLILVPWLFGWHEFESNPDLNKTFDVALHIGTFVGATAYFAPDLRRLSVAAARSIRERSISSQDSRLAWLLLLSALPAAAVGALFEGPIQDRLGEEWLIALFLVVFGLVLLVADQRSPQARGTNDFGLRDALLMGVAQASALAPGVSRSGVTITAGRFLRLGRESATRLSFLMSLPIIGGAGLYKALDVLKSGGLPAGTGAAFAWGMLTSAVTGAAAVWGTLRLVRTGSFLPFVVYRVLAGLAVLAVLATSFR